MNKNENNYKIQIIKTKIKVNKKRLVWLWS